MIKIIKQLVDKESTYLFAISMGMDSVSAFLWMRSRGYKVVPIHFNHGIRKQNDLMQEKFTELRSLHILRNTSQWEVAGFATGYTEKNKESKLQTEAQYRSARLNFYQRASNWANPMFYFKESIPIIITAHHLNDYVENYLLNCFRGHPNHTPIELSSTFNPPEDSNPDLFNTSYKIIHPFLLTKKEDFKQYIERNNYMNYVIEDETNTESKGSRRNWIRNKIIPEMLKNKLSLEKYAKRKIESSLKLKSFMLQ